MIVYGGLANRFDKLNALLELLVRQSNFPEERVGMTHQRVDDLFEPGVVGPAHCGKHHVRNRISIVHDTVQMR